MSLSLIEATPYVGGAAAGIDYDANVPPGRRQSGMYVHVYIYMCLGSTDATSRCVNTSGWNRPLCYLNQLSRYLNDCRSFFTRRPHHDKSLDYEK